MVWDESSDKAHWKNRKEGQAFFAIFNSTKSHESQIRIRPHEQVLDPAKVSVPSYHPDTREVREDWAQYYDNVSRADADAGIILREIEAAGLEDETIVFYYGDHGSGMPRSKRWPCNSGLQVPIVVYFPEKWQHLAPAEYQAGGKSNRLISFVDLAPTLLSIAGVEPPDWMQGLAFAGPYQTSQPEYLHGFRGRMDECQDLVRSVTDGRYVYLRNYMPHVSQGQYVAFQFVTPTTRIWRELFDSGKATEAQSIFWKTPKAPEELYDLWNDPDEVHNLANSNEHRAILKKLRKEQYKHALKIKDVGFLPEGEIHSRSEGSTPYDMARQKGKYPVKAILFTADLASNLDPAALPKLIRLMKHKDSAVRYWAAMGVLMRGKDAVGKSETALLAALKDSSPYVRVAAARALAEYGSSQNLTVALDLLVKHSSLEENGVFVSMSALSALRVLGSKAAAVHPVIFKMNTTGPYPNSRYSTYVVRLIQAMQNNVSFK